MTATVLDRARGGDQRAFGELVAPYRPELHVHCYRMLGSLADADDALQETLIAAWTGLGGFRAEASLRTWLYRIATNRCLTMLRRRPAAPEPPFPVPAPTAYGDVTWLQPYPSESAEAVELAFVRALQLLPRRQTAVLLLREVLAFSTTETAEMLAMTPVAVKAALQRARERLRAEPPPVRDVAAESGVARRFAAALTAGDIDAVLALLTDDAWLAMPPAPHEYHGPAAVGAFLRASRDRRGPARLRLDPVPANGQPAFAEFHGYHPVGVTVLTVTAAGLRGVTRFLDPALPPRFGIS